MEVTPHGEKNEASDREMQWRLGRSHQVVCTIPRWHALSGIVARVVLWVLFVLLRLRDSLQLVW